MRDRDGFDLLPGERARLVKRSDSPGNCIGERLGTLETVAGRLWLRLDEPYCGQASMEVQRSWLDPA